MNERQKIEHLFNLYREDKCSDEQVRLLFDYINAEENGSIFKTIIENILESSHDVNTDADLPKDVSLDDIYQMIKKKIEGLNKES